MVKEDFYGLRLQIARIDGLKPLSPYADEFKLWQKDTEASLAVIYGGQSHQVQAFQNIMYTPLFLSCRCGDTVFSDAFHAGLEEARSLLESFAGGVK